MNELRHCANCTYYNPCRFNLAIGDCMKKREAVTASDRQCDQFKEFVTKNQN